MNLFRSNETFRWMSKTLSGFHVYYTLKEYLYAKTTMTIRSPKYINSFNRVSVSSFWKGDEILWSIKDANTYFSVLLNTRDLEMKQRPGHTLSIHCMP